MEYSYNIFEIAGVLLISFLIISLPILILRIVERVVDAHNEKVKRQNAVFDKLDSIESRLNKIDEVLKDGKY